VLVDGGLEILTEAECRRLIATESVGRIAVSVSALPAIFPVNYVLDGDDLLFLTGEGMKANAAFRGTVVAFEVDHLDPEHRTGWSVLLVGQARLVTDEERATLGPVRLSPWAEGERANLVRIHPEFVSGRRIIKEP
jgi:nitroimidazol reductase NimA-like FMN-containing flavoprotein (pyridoxamine 5'-phosphate oxidase superfamily)